MSVHVPRLVVAGLSGDSGKTIVSLALTASLRERGLKVSTFKKGPDYIDAAWLTEVSGRNCRNLDSYLMSADDIMHSFLQEGENADIAIIEGNRGIFDGRNSEGTHSTAELAKLLQTPVLLVINAAKVTRTLAAIVKGCLDFDPEVKVAGIILNGIAGKRHETTIRESLAAYTSVPVLGTLPAWDKGDSLIPGRHLGLVTPSEFIEQENLSQRLVQLGENNLEIEQIVELANSANDLPHRSVIRPVPKPQSVKVGVFRDSAFTFYYPENLEALEDAGAELVTISSLEDDHLPDIDALYIGGGFPETHAERMSSNRALLDAVKEAVENNLPVYAECGGLVFLSKSIEWEGKVYPMAGVFPLELTMQTKPVGHGYTEIEIAEDNPFFEKGIKIKGHEFHYSGPKEEILQSQCCMRVVTGVGLGNKLDGQLYRNCLATYMHIHALGTSAWAPGLIAAAQRSRDQKKSEDSLSEGQASKLKVMT